MRVAFLLQLVPLLVSPGLAAPRTGSRSEKSDQAAITNPFAAEADNLSLLQEYLKEKDPLEETASNMKRETAIVHLFLIHDFDKSGYLDGLELMRLLSGILVKRFQNDPDEELVVLLVDEVLEKQDLNMDGLLSAQELITPPFHKEESEPFVHVAIPPPPVPHTGGLLEATDNDTNTNTEILKELGSIDQPVENRNIDQDQPQINEPAEAISSREEPRVEDNEDEVEDVQDPGEETLDADVDNEM